jgi:signal transduction histidine kinase
MTEGYREVFRGIRLIDWVLAAALSALGVLLMLENIGISDADVARNVASGTFAHTMSTHTWWMLPVCLLGTLPVLWWRRNALAVTVICTAVMLLHDVLFQYVGRCGSGLPLVFVLAYLGAVAYDRRRAAITFAVTVVLAVAVLAADSIAGLSALVLVLPVQIIVFGIGVGVRHRTALSAELRARNAELRRLRDERASLEIASDRARLSQELDGLLQVRLEQLGRAAESAEGLDVAQSRALLETIEADSRATLDDMREIVGLLRGGDVALAPTPTVAHLDALLARHSRVDSRLTVTGDPRSLPAAVELSAYRIVEHLLDAMADQSDSRIDVGLRFDDDTVEIHVDGPVERGADLKAAATRARERAKLLGGSLDLKVSRGQASAVAHLPVLG